MKPTTGTALGGRYRLDRLIAVGGMGEVWVAHDLSLRRDVAVKVLREEFAGDAGFLARFRTEARNAASLSHPNIAATYDYGEQSGSSYLVMELVTGEPLSDLLERRPVLEEDRLLPVLAQTARALHAAHVAGVVHRDVKPGNILLGPRGRVKITDFGVSTAPDQAPMTATGMVMGTAQYLSPEQAVGRPATASSDLYSLGVVAYEALAGHRPFTGPTAVDIAVAHVNDPVPPLPATVGPAVADVVMGLLAKDPADRPPSAAALARTLDRLLGHTPPDGTPLDDDDPATPVAPQETGGPARDAVAPLPPQPPAPPADLRRPPAPAADRPHPPRSGAVSRPPSYPPRRDVPDPRTGTRPPARHHGGHDRPPRDHDTRDHPNREQANRDHGADRDYGADRDHGADHGRRDPAGQGDRHAATPRTGAPVRDTTGSRTTGTRAAAAAARRGRPTAAEPVRTSTTTGRRLGPLGRWSWPLLALVVLLLALLAAALTDSVGDAGQGTAATAPVICGPAWTTPDGPVASASGGMITPCAPPGTPAVPTPSTAKDA